MVPTTTEILWGVISGDILSTAWQRLTSNTGALLSLGFQQIAQITGTPLSQIFNFIGSGATYIGYVGGQQVSLSTPIKYPVLAGGIAVCQETTGSVRNMVQLMPMKIDKVGAASVLSSNGERFEMADDAQVYLWYKGQYYATKLTSVNSDDYYLTGWYDNFGCAAGKRSAYHRRGQEGLMPGYYSRPARLGRQARQLLLPRRCPYCREVLGTLLRCEACMPRLEELRRSPTMRLARASHYLGRLEGAAAPTGMRASSGTLSSAPNTRGQSRTAVELGVEMTARLFGAKVEMHFAEPVPGPVAGAAVGYDCIIPVPARQPSARLQRAGADGPAAVVHALGLPLLPKALCRARAGRHQAGLSLEERLVNVAGAFRAQEPELVEGKRVLLVDDVITTGATAAACAQALLDAGAHSVFAVALAASGGEMDAASNASEA